MKEQIKRQALAVLAAVSIGGNGAMAQENFRLTRPGASQTTQGQSADAAKGTAPGTGSQANPPALPADASMPGAATSETDAGGASSHESSGGSRPIQMHIEKSVTSVRLNKAELTALGGRDIVVVIDRSTSMRTMDCPSLEYPGFAVSRWEWCREQTLDLAKQTSTVLPEGVSVVLFSTFARAFPHVDMRQIPMIFTTNVPGGMTNEAYALKMVLDDYFGRREASHGKVRPLLVAVITDGLPTNMYAVIEVLMEAAHEMKRPDEIKFTFLQVGQDPEGVSFIRNLDRNLMKERAKYDIVYSETFDELLKTGLAKALVDSITEQR